MTFVLSTDEATIVSLATLDGGPRQFTPVALTPGGGPNSAHLVKAGGAATPVPGDGASTQVFALLHTSQTGTRLIQCSWTGVCSWSGAPVQGTGLFDTLVSSFGTPLVGAASYTFQIIDNPYAQFASVTLHHLLEPSLPLGAADVFTDMGAVANANFTLAQTGPNQWSINDGGVLAYNGTIEGTVRVLVTVTATVESVLNTTDVRGIGIALNGDLIGLVISSDAALTAGSQWVTAFESIGGGPSGECLLVTRRLVTMATDDTVQPVFARNAPLAATGGTLEAYSMTVEVLSDVVYDGSKISGGFIAVATAAIGVAEQVDVNFEFSAPGGNPDDEFIWQGSLVVTDL